MVRRCLRVDGAAAVECSRLPDAQRGGGLAQRCAIGCPMLSIRGGGGGGGGGGARARARTRGAAGCSMLTVCGRPPAATCRLACPQIRCADPPSPRCRPCRCAAASRSRRQAMRSTAGCCTPRGASSGGWVGWGGGGVGVVGVVGVVVGGWGGGGGGDVVLRNLDTVDTVDTEGGGPSEAALWHASPCPIFSSA